MSNHSVSRCMAKVFRWSSTKRSRLTRPLPDDLQTRTWEPGSYIAECPYTPPAPHPRRAPSQLISKVRKYRSRLARPCHHLFLDQMWNTTLKQSNLPQNVSTQIERHFPAVCVTIVTRCMADTHMRTSVSTRTRKCMPLDYVTNAMTKSATKERSCGNRPRENRVRICQWKIMWSHSKQIAMSRRLSKVKKLVKKKRSEIKIRLHAIDKYNLMEMISGELTNNNFIYF